MVPRNLRAGFDNTDGGEDAPDAEVLTKFGVLMRLFSEDAARVAGHCAIARGSCVVSADDMRDALKYVARNFFSSPDLEQRFPPALEEARADFSEGSDDSDDSDDSIGSDGSIGSGGEAAGGSGTDADADTDSSAAGTAAPTQGSWAISA